MTVRDEPPDFRPLAERVERAESDLDAAYATYAGVRDRFHAAVDDLDERPREDHRAVVDLRTDWLWLVAFAVRLGHLGERRDRIEREAP